MELLELTLEGFLHLVGFEPGELQLFCKFVALKPKSLQLLLVLLVLF